MLILIERVRPAAGLTVGLMATVSWIVLPAYLLIKLF